MPLELEKTHGTKIMISTANRMIYKRRSSYVVMAAIMVVVVVVVAVAVAVAVVVVAPVAVAPVAVAIPVAV